MREVVFDLETTGFEFSRGHRIVEIGAVEMVNGAITGRSYHCYINPERSMPAEAFRVHGLDDAFLRNKPVFAAPEAAPAFLDFTGNARLVAHNGIRFDLPFLNAELSAANLGTMDNSLLDTLDLARRKFPGAPANLDALCSRFGIDTKKREREGHGALLDSHLLAEVYIELTGGAQADLGFDRTEPGPEEKNGTQGGTWPSPGPRPSPLAAGLTEDEARAHRKMIEQMGENCLWKKKKEAQT